MTTAFAPRDWHVHEMLYGYLPAVMTGLPAHRDPELDRPAAAAGHGRCSSWSLSGSSGASPSRCRRSIGWVAGGDRSTSRFLAAARRAAAREIVAGRNWRNLQDRRDARRAARAPAISRSISRRMFDGIAGIGTRVGIAAVVLLITLIGGRIVPSFTRNWLAREEAGPAAGAVRTFRHRSRSRSSAAALALWVAAPASRMAPPSLLTGRRAAIVRLGAGPAIARCASAFVLILHVGYAFVPSGSCSPAWRARPRARPAPAIHAWTARRGRHHDARRHDPREPRPYRPRADRRRAAHAGDLCRRARRRARADLRHARPAWSAVLLHLTVVAWAAAFVSFGICFAPICCAQTNHLRALSGISSVSAAPARVPHGTAWHPSAVGERQRFPRVVPSKLSPLSGTICTQTLEEHSPWAFRTRPAENEAEKRRQEREEAQRRKVDSRWRRDWRTAFRARIRSM